MPHRIIPQTPSDFFYDKLSKLTPGATRIVVLDRERYLELSAELTDANGTTWRVLPYQNNDLVFRAQYVQLENSVPRIVWVLPSDFEPDAKIELSYIADVLDRAEDIVDLSLAGILKRLAPREAWIAETLAPFATLISRNLPAFLTAYEDLRQLIGGHVPLNVQHFRMMALVSTQPELALKELFFEETEPDQVLRRYLRLAWARQWDEQAQTMLQDLAANSRADTATIQPWLGADPHELALYVYLHDVATKYRISNPVNQLRGLGLVSLNIEALEPHAQVAIGLLSDQMLSAAVERIAEEGLTERNARELAQLVVSDNLQDIQNALQSETSPPLVYALAVRLLTLGNEKRTLAQTLAKWHPPSAQLVGDTSKGFGKLGQNALQLITRLAFIERALATGLQLSNDLTKLLDAYLASLTHNLELTHARARHDLKNLPDPALKGDLSAYLDDQHNRIRGYLEKIDLQLAQTIAAD